jgi:hypothetical protein
MKISADQSLDKITAGFETSKDFIDENLPEVIIILVCIYSSHLIFV